MDSVSKGYTYAVATVVTHVTVCDSTIKHHYGKFPKENSIPPELKLKFPCLSSNNILMKQILAAIACVCRNSKMIVINITIFLFLTLLNCKLWHVKLLDSAPFSFLLMKPTYTAA